jgi:hypothetical protein
LSPSLVSLGCDVAIGLGVGEVKVIEDDFVEVTRSSFGNGFDERAIFGVGVVERLEIVGFVDGEPHAPGNLDSVVNEDFFTLSSSWSSANFPLRYASM